MKTLVAIVVCAICGYFLAGMSIGKVLTEAQKTNEALVSGFRK